MASTREEQQAKHGFHLRVRHGMRKPHNWVQLAKFLLVGLSGYVVNLAVFTFSLEVLGVHHIAAATIAFGVAVMNNFWWNRHWTFGAGEGHAGFQAARFFAVSVVAFLIQVSLLELLISAAGTPKVLAQAISLVMATPVNFIGNKLWSFRL
ncbi:MAG TPA: GtrA family protein [Thermoleophilaceae bacterium]|nr:GtrA family protein [Thermoleophilaceae bacterium]